MDQHPGSSGSKARALYSDLTSSLGLRDERGLLGPWLGGSVAPVGPVRFESFSRPSNTNPQAVTITEPN
jgi:hypothetical protein